jgi:hypothetical protein
MIFSKTINSLKKEIERCNKSGHNEDYREELYAQLTLAETLSKNVESEIDKLAVKEKAKEVNIGEYDKFVSVHDLKQKLKEL